jgi:lipoprotein-releasing system ATP-binding protein
MSDILQNDAIVLEGVRKDYVIESNRVDALRGVDLRVPAGSMVAVTGKSGAGKSTLLHIIGTLDRPSAGRVILNGVDLSTLPDHAISRFRNRSIGFVFQMHNLLPEFSAVENVMMPGIIAGMARGGLRDRAVRLLSAVGLADRIEHKPSELSGGEQQRVAIARALFMSPPLIVADEPTGNLDKKTSLMIQELLIDVVRANQMTLLLVTHDLELAARLPSQVVMDDGLVINDGVLR